METWFRFDSIQRKGVLFVILLIILTASINYGLFRKKLTKEIVNKKEVASVQQFIDSLKKTEQKTQRDSIYISPFNPNFMTDYRGFVLGLSVDQIDRIQQYREKGTWINSLEEFQEVTGVSDSLMTQLSPYFKFPEWVTAKESEKQHKTKTSTNLTDEQKKDLNTATQQELMEIRGVGEVLSRRIVSYRNSINRFLDDVQLKDIYGLDYETREKIKEKFTVKTTGEFEKIEVNTATVEDLLEIPYFDYELARKIVEYRLTHEGITSFEELDKIDGYPIGRDDRIQLYLEIQQ